LILDAGYERVREAGVIASQAVLLAIGIDWDGRRQVLAVELANRESRSSWRDFLLGLKARGLHGVEFVVADDHAGLRAALREALAEAGLSALLCPFSQERATCRAGSTTTACRSSVGYMTAAISPRPVAIWLPGLPNGPANIQAHRLGRREHRRNADVLPAAAAAS
jgi:transposase-like protein